MSARHDAAEGKTGSFLTVESSRLLSESLIDHRPDTEGQDWNDVQYALASEPKSSTFTSPAGTAGRSTPYLKP
jgi:hypothetical protein